MKKIGIYHLATLLALSIFTFATYGLALQKDGLLKVYFLNVGQGDAIFIETPNGHQVLIDGGPGPSVLTELGEVMPFFDKSIDVVIVTHPHADHINGLIEVLSHYEVGTVIEAEEDYDSPSFQSWEDAIRTEGANEIEALAGTNVDLGGGVSFVILAPDKSWLGVKARNPHEASVVAKLKYGDFELMLTGDTESPLEQKMVLQGVDVESDVLKVGHHGSDTSSSQEFLSVVRPQLAIIQVGQDNRYGHPSPEILKRLENFKIKYYRNDIDGRVKLVTDGRYFSVIK